MNPLLIGLLAVATLITIVIIISTQKAKKAAEIKAAETQKAAEEKRQKAVEIKAAEEKTKKAAEIKAAEAQKADEEKMKKAAEAQKIAEEKAAADRKIAEETPAVDVKRPELPQSNETEGGILTYKEEYHQKPKFYEGSVPVIYLAGKKHTGMSMVTVYYKFDSWRTDFFYTDMAMEISGVADGARTVDNTGRLLAEAKMLNVLQGEGIEIEEFHYLPDGKVRFYCKSQISFPFGQKIKEADVMGKKAKDYYFLWPVNTN